MQIVRQSACKCPAAGVCSERPPRPRTRHAPAATPPSCAAYLDTLRLVERLHRLLLDVIKDEFERLGIIDVNAVQALLLFNIGDNEVTAGELKTRGYYQGSNVSYNLKKLVECGYMHHQRSEVDRRSVRVRLTDKGRNLRAIVAGLFQRHADGIVGREVLGNMRLDGHQRQPAADGALLVRPDPLHLLTPDSLGTASDRSRGVTHMLPAKIAATALHAPARRRSNDDNSS